MANKTITNLKELEVAKASDVLLIENATETLKITKQNLLQEFATEIYVQQKIAEASLSGGEVDDLKTEVEMARGTHNTLNDRLDNVDEIQAQTNAQLSADKNELNARIDTFLSLPEGSTIADAELMDIRVGRNGIVYDCAGTAVRQQFLDVETRLDGGELVTVSKSGDFFAEFDNVVGDISITSTTAINAFSYTKNLAPFEVIAKSSDSITIDEETDEYVILTIQPNSPWQNITLKSFYLQEGNYVFTRYVEYLKGEPVNNAFTVYMDHSEDGKEFTSDNTKILNVEEMKELLLKLDCIKSELK